MIGRRFAAALLPRLFGTNPRSHHKGATGRVRTGDQRLPVLCHCQLGQDIPIYVFRSLSSFKLNLQSLKGTHRIKCWLGVKRCQTEESSIRMWKSLQKFGHNTFLGSCSDEPCTYASSNTSGYDSSEFMGQGEDKSWYCDIKQNKYFSKAFSIVTESIEFHHLFRWKYGQLSGIFA